MSRYPRLRALLILLGAMVLGAVYLCTWGRPAPAGGAVGLEELRRKAEGDANAPADAWLAYADALDRANQPAKAIDAYRAVLAKAPDHRKARFGLALALLK